MIDKETQRIAWSCLPKEFKEEVKEYYNNSPALGAKAVLLLENLFGIHNLTSDAGGEDEMLCVKRKWVQEMYKNNCDEIRRENISSSDKDCYEYANEVLKTLFGSKCLLPDEEYTTCVHASGTVCKHYNHEEHHCSLHGECKFETYTEPKQSVTDSIDLNNPTVTCTDDCPSQYPSQDFNTILKDGFREHNRLNIAMQFAVKLTNASYREINSIGEDAKGYATEIAKAALVLTDALIKEAEKGGSHDND